MTGTRVISEEELRNKKPVMLFGRDVREIPCFRLSFIYGICGGFAGGLVCFMCTSKGKLSTNVGFVSLWVTVFGYWIPCRYRYEVHQYAMEQIRQARKERSTPSSS